MAGFPRGLAKPFLKSIHSDSLVGSIPESVYAVFQLTFAIITVALICGSIAERMRFSAFFTIYSLLVYAGLFTRGALGVG